MRAFVEDAARHTDDFFLGCRPSHRLFAEICSSEVPRNWLWLNPDSSTPWLSSSSKNGGTPRLLATKHCRNLLVVQKKTIVQLVFFAAWALSLAASIPDPASIPHYKEYRDPADQMDEAVQPRQVKFCIRPAFKLSRASPFIRRARKSTQSYRKHQKSLWNWLSAQTLPSKI